jgi:hypothetical protein
MHLTFVPMQNAQVLRFAQDDNANTDMGGKSLPLANNI